MRKKEKGAPHSAACQLRQGSRHPFGALRGYVPLGTGQEQVYRQLREAIPVLDAAVGKLVRLSGGFSVECKDPKAQRKLEAFLENVPCGRGQVGINSFLAGYLDSLLVYGRSIGEIVTADGAVRAVCWGDVTQLQILEGDSPLEMVLCGPDKNGQMRPLPYPYPPP